MYNGQDNAFYFFDARCFMKLVLLDVDSTVVPFRVEVCDRWCFVDEELVAELPVESRLGLLRQGDVLDLVPVTCGGEELWVDSGFLCVLQSLIARVAVDESLMVVWLTQRVANGGASVGGLLNDAFGVDFGVIELVSSLFDGDGYFLKGKVLPGLRFIEELRGALPDGEVLEVLWLDDDFVEFGSCCDLALSACSGFDDVVADVPVIDYWLGARPHMLSQFIPE